MEDSIKVTAGGSGSAVVYGGGGSGKWVVGGSGGSGGSGGGGKWVVGGSDSDIVCYGGGGGSNQVGNGSGFISENTTDSNSIALKEKQKFCCENLMKIFVENVEVGNSTVGEIELHICGDCKRAWMGLFNGKALDYIEIFKGNPVYDNHIDVNIGYEEGETCNREGCKGFVELYPLEGCTCHCGNPPCSACVDAKEHCNECGWEMRECSGDEAQPETMFEYVRESLATEKRCVERKKQKQKEADKVRVVACVNSTGIEDQFDEGVDYLYKGEKKEFILVENKLGEEVSCFQDRFGKIEIK